MIVTKLYVMSMHLHAHFSFLVQIKSPAISCGACVISNSLFQLILQHNMPRHWYSLVSD